MAADLRLKMLASFDTPCDATPAAAMPLIMPAITTPMGIKGCVMRPFFTGTPNA
jgi:hypothetical protein